VIIKLGVEDAEMIENVGIVQLMTVGVRIRQIRKRKIIALNFAKENNMSYFLFSELLPIVQSISGRSVGRLEVFSSGNPGCQKIDLVGCHQTTS
jgi:hypothetical protein